MKQRKRIAALLMAGVMLFSSLPANALGAERQTTGSLCEHHPAHTAECGYAEGTEGTPCNHQHTDECYTFVTNCVHEHGADCYPAEGVSDNAAAPSGAETAEPTACTHVCSEESGCISKELDCKHEHNSECGYTPAAEGTPCTYVCPICSVQAQINALPTADELGNMTEEEQQAAYEKLQAAYDAYNALTDEQKAEITGAEIFDSLFDVFNGMVNTLENQERYNINESAVTIDASCGDDCSGHTITGDGNQTDHTITVTGGTHNITIENVDISVGRYSSAFSIASGAKVNLTLVGTNKLKSGDYSAGLQVPSGATLMITKASDGGSLEANSGYLAAGIGGGHMSGGGNITIEGGTVTATGDDGAGIGGGPEGSGGNITISGGTVTAIGGSVGAGIGGGHMSGGGNITITGGNVTVQGGQKAAGIGGGCKGSGSNAGNNCDSFTVGGNAVIIVTSGNPMIADPDSDRADWKGVIIEGSTGQVYGDATLSGDFTIPSGTTVTVPEGSSLTIEKNVTLTVGDNAKLINNGTIKGDTDSTGGTLDGTGELTGTGTVADTITNKLRKDSAVDVNISPSSAVYGSAVTLTATISRDTNTRTRTAAQNTVNFYLGTADNGKLLGTANVNGDTATLSNVTITERNGWMVGENTITAEYGGSMTLSPKTGTAMLTVTIRLDTPGNPHWDSTTPGRAVWDAVENADSYWVQLYKNGALEGTPVKATETAHQFNITEAGAYTFKVYAVGTDNYSDSYDAESGKLTFYAVSFDTDGGSPAPEAQCVLSGSQAKEPEAPSKNGYIFQGWYKDDTKWDFKNKITDNTTLTAKWEKELSYISYSWDENAQKLMRSDTKTTEPYTLLTDGSADTAWKTGWYVVEGTVNLPSRVTVTGNVRLILKDGCHLNAGNGGIQVELGNSLTIYAQSEGESTMGRLTATATDNNCAGIGGGSKRGGSAGGDITIHGGRIDAKGARFGAGIGSGSAMGTDGSTTIYGGIVTAEGDSDGYGAGIGCAYYGNCGTVTIRGGSVTAQAGTDDSYGAGIGDGCYADGGGTIIISGGTVNAKGGTSCGAVIGSKKGTVTISGGIVTTTCTSPNVGGIGGKDSTLTISGGTVTATGKKGIDCGSFSTTEQGNAVIITESFIPQVDESSLSGVIIVDWRGQVYGTNVTPTDDFTIPRNKDLAIPEGSTLTIRDDVTAINEGTIYKYGEIDGTVTNQNGGVILEESSTTVFISDFDGTITEVAYGDSFFVNATVQKAAVTRAAGDYEGYVNFYVNMDGQKTSLGSSEVENGTAQVHVNMNGNRWKDNWWKPGDYTITAEFLSSDTLMKSTGSGTLKVTTKEITKNMVTWPTEVTYTGGDQTPAVTVQGLKPDTDYTVSYSRNEQATTDFTNAGEIMITVTGIGNYAGTAEAAYTIKPAELAISGATLAAKTYDGSKMATVESVDFDGVKGKDSLILDDDYTATAEFADADAGMGKTATVSVTLKNGNYKLSDSTYQLPGQTIAKADSTLTAAPAPVEELVYNGQDQALVTAGEAVGGTMVYSLTENGTYTETIPAGTEARTYTVWYKVAGDANHSDTIPASVEVRINPLPVELTWGDTAFTYDGNEKSVTATVTNAVDGDDVVLSYENNTAIKVGNYTAKVTALDNGNYTLTDAAGTEQPWSISQGDSRLGLAVDDESPVYGATITFKVKPDVQPSKSVRLLTENMVTFTAGDVELGKVLVQEGEETTFAYNTNGKGLAIGENIVTATYTGGGNLNGTSEDITVTLAPKTLTASVDGTAVKRYDGTANAVVALTLAGTETGDAVTASAAQATYNSANAAEAAAVTAAGITLGGQDAGWYTVNETATAAGSITPAVLTVTANTREKTYGDADPELTYIAKGLVGSDKLEGGLARTEGEHVGEYEINQGTLTAGSNYTIAFTAAKLTIRPLAVELTWSNTAFTYNGSEQCPAAAVSNKVNEADQVNVTVTGGQTNAGAPPYTASATGLTGAEAGNYTLAGCQNTTQTFTIGKAAPTVSEIMVDSPDILYDTTELSAITLSHTGTEGNLVLDGNQTLTVGEEDYAWTFTPADGNNYTTATGSIKLTVAEDTVQSIAVTKAPDKTEYIYGESLDLTGMAVIATYATGRTEDVTAAVTITPETLTTSVTELNIVYGGLSAKQAVTVKPREVDDPTIILSGTSFAYTGEEIRPDITVKDGNTVIPESEYTVEYADNTNVGKATVTIWDNEGGNYTVSGTASFKITKAAAQVTKIPAANTLIYTGEAQELVTYGAASGGTLQYSTEEDGDYTASVPTAVNAGDYPVFYKVVGDANHSDTEPAEVKVTITPAVLTINGAMLAGKTYDGTTGAVVAGVTFDEAALTLGRDYTAAAEFDNPGAGADKTAAVTVTLKNSNYTFGDGDETTYTLTGQTIGKADFIGVVSISGSVLADCADSVTLPQIPDGASYGTAVSGDDLTGLAIADGVLSYTGGSKIRKGQSYTVTVPVNGGANYNDYAITVTLIGTDKQALPITGVTAAAGLVYNGQAQPGYTGAPGAEGYSGDFTVTYSTEDKKAPINAGTYTVTIAIPEDETRYVGSITLAFTIAKRQLTVTAEDQQVQQHQPMPEFTYTVSGLADGDVFTDPDMVIAAADTETPGEYAIVIRGGALSNESCYDVVYVNGTLTVTKAFGGGDDSTGGDNTNNDDVSDNGGAGGKDDASDNGDTGGSDNAGTVPGTGDNSQQEFWVSILLVSLVCLILLRLSQIRRQERS